MIPAARFDAVTGAGLPVTPSDFDAYAQTLEWEHAAPPPPNPPYRLTDEPPAAGRASLAALACAILDLKGRRQLRLDDVADAWPWGATHHRALVGLLFTDPKTGIAERRCALTAGEGKAALVLAIRAALDGRRALHIETVSHVQRGRAAA